MTAPKDRPTIKEDDMLVTTRKTGEVIHIGDDITITVVTVGMGRVRLGITAPKDVPVFRKEIYDAIRAERAREAAEDEKGAA